jgi:hypothetical protein
MQHILDAYYQRFPEQSKGMVRGPGMLSAAPTRGLSTPPIGQALGAVANAGDAAVPAPTATSKFGAGFKFNFSMKRSAQPSATPTVPTNPTDKRA